MHGGLAYLNDGCNEIRLGQRNDIAQAWAYDWFMSAERHPWHLKAWLKELGQKQEWVARETGINKATVSLLANDKQPYSQEDITAIAKYLKIAPYELLMHPQDALALRDFRSSAQRVAALDDVPTDEFEDEFSEVRVPAAPPRQRRAIPRRTGTTG
jgi:transcriptional regulator with XRE-family HTH domain